MTAAGHFAKGLRFFDWAFASAISFSRAVKLYHVG